MKKELTSAEKKAGLFIVEKMLDEVECIYGPLTEGAGYEVLELLLGKILRKDASNEISGEEVNLLIGNYYGWMKLYGDWEREGEYIVITTPYLDRHNDYIDIYVKKVRGDYIISDGGETLSDLELDNHSIVKDVLKRYDTVLRDGVLYGYAPSGEFNHKKYNLIQAILAINAVAPYLHEISK